MGVISQVWNDIGDVLNKVKISKITYLNKNMIYIKENDCKIY